MQYGRGICLLGMLIMVTLLCACHSHKNKPSIPQKQALVSSVTPPKALAQGYHAVSASVHTARIGSPDAPTIDGGIINAADGLPVYQDDVPSPLHPLPKKPVNPPKADVAISSQDTSSSQPTSTQKTLDDGWATNAHVNAVLAKAASEGKLNVVLQDANQHHLPATVALVPIVESAYQTNAISPKGAAGDWQIMPAAAKDLGLSQEERFDFNKATDGALTMLQSLHERFGNWALTFAAYNAGAARVAKALASHPGATSLNELGLPPETIAYVERIQSVSRLLANERLN